MTGKVNLNHINKYVSIHSYDKCRIKYLDYYKYLHHGKVYQNKGPLNQQNSKFSVYS